MSVEQPDESILSKVKKIWSLSQKNSNENEAALAAQKVQELLIRYNISESILNEDDEEPEEEVKSFWSRDHMEGRNHNVQKWKADLADYVARGNLCQVLYLSDGRIIEWIGKPSNVEVAKYLWITLIADLERICEDKWKTIEAIRNLEQKHNVSLFKSHSELRWVHGKTWKNSFYVGANMEINRRLQEGLGTLQQEPAVSALVVYNDQAVQKFIDNKYPKLSGGFRGASAHSTSGFESGRATGREIQFKKGVGGSYGHAGLLKG